MKNLQIGRVKTFEIPEIAGCDEFAVHPILQTIAVSKEDELILITNKVSWKTERRGVEVVSLAFRTDGNQIVACLADGRALIVDDGELVELEVAELADGAAEWSADEQLLALADNQRLFLADSSLVPFIERSLAETDMKSVPMNVGWGSEATQFRGSAGKFKKEEEKKEIIAQNSTKTEVHWRWDSEILAVLHLENSVRILTIFDRNGEILNRMNTRNVQLSNCFAHRPNANLLCSAILQSESQDDRIVFYERNGETRNSYVVKWPQNNQERRKIERIEWNPTGQILAMQTASGKASQCRHKSEKRMKQLKSVSVGVLLVFATFWGSSMCK
uniref:Elongator complex protein 1 n=1 Tax=Caenorhabditis tropicalis TaxID=1561998 RepID=A0A1I7TRQ2_9PELO